MAINFEINLAEFIRKIEATTEEIGQGAKRGLEDVMDDWRRKSRDLAPLKDRGDIRDSMDYEIRGEGIDLTGEITAVKVEIADKGKWSGKRFNIAYYLHEVFPKKYGDSFKHPSTPGTIPQFFDKPAKDNKEKWMQKIEHEIEQQVKRRGW